MDGAPGDETRLALKPPPQPPSQPKDPDWDDYWAHKVAEKAKTRVLAYFGLATLLLALLGIKGLDEVRKSIEEKFEKEIAKKEREASDKVKKMLLDFEKQLEGSKQEVAQRKNEFLKMAVLPPEFRAAAISPNVGASLSLDLQAQIGTIRDQGSEGATVGFSVAYALQAEIKKKFNRSAEISARGLYVMAKKYDEFEGENYEGTSVTGALKAARTAGAYLESQWPYHGSAPNPAVKAPYRITGHKDLGTNLEAIVQALKSGKIPIATLTITSDFDNPSEDGRVIVRTPLKELGGHSMAIVGFDQEKAEFKLANMWGTKWGARGFAVLRDTDLKKILQNALVIDDVVDTK